MSDTNPPPNRGVMSIESPRHTPAEGWLKELQSAAKGVKELRARADRERSPEPPAAPLAAPSWSR